MNDDLNICKLKYDEKTNQSVNAIAEYCKTLSLTEEQIDELLRLVYEALQNAENCGCRSTSHLYQLLMLAFFGSSGSGSSSPDVPLQ